MYTVLICVRKNGSSTERATSQHNKSNFRRLFRLEPRLLSLIVFGALQHTRMRVHELEKRYSGKFLNILGKGKVKIHPRTGNEGPEME